MVVATCVAPPLVAVADPRGAYAGDSVGQTTVKADPLQFNKHDWGWRVLLGIRPLPLLGAEIASPSQLPREQQQWMPSM